MKQKKELINLYIDGELNPIDTQKVEKMIAEDVDLQQYFENLVRLNGLLGSAYELPKDQANDDYVAAIIPKQKTGLLVKFSSINWLQAMAVAASVSAVMVINNTMFSNNIDLSIIEKHITMTRYDALENKLSNDSLSWNDEANNVSVVITPIKTFKSSNGSFCREYKEVVNNNGEITSRSGFACRKEKGNWPNRTVVSDLYNQG